MTLNSGDQFTINDKIYKVISFLGDGGQGIVYLVSDGVNQQALKIYKEEPSSDFIYNLKNNIRKGSPSESFLWPKELIDFNDGVYGYLMDVRGNEYLSFRNFINGAVKFKSKTIFLNWCIELVKAFKDLHSMGYSYQDLNEGAFFLNPNNGKLLICDNDNITADKYNLGILGVPGYMAPEVFTERIDPDTNNKYMPDIHTDRYSLAVILFNALCKGDPFCGECLKKYTPWSEEAEKEVYGFNPVYVYSNVDTSNRPIRGYHTAVLKNYPSLPSYIKDAFHKTFVDGLKDRENSRTTELEWITLLCKYRDELIYCNCGEEYIYGFSEKSKNTSCPNCQKKTGTFTYLHIGKHNIVLEPGKNLYKVHIDKYSSEYNIPVATVITNPNNPSLWGIRLNLDNDVLIKDKSGVEKTIAKDGVIPILSNLKIKFNESAIAEIICVNN